VTGRGVASRIIKNFGAGIELFYATVLWCKYLTSDWGRSKLGFCCRTHKSSTPFAL
jgi:hypothetical protein